MPTTTGIATEFITFTRASNATVTDSDGRVKWAPHNLLTNSESFGAASWTKPNSTVIANTSDTTAPNSTSTADKLRVTTANSPHGAVFDAASLTLATGTKITVSVFAKKGELSWCLLGDSQQTGVYFNLDTGSIGTVTAGWTGEGITPIGTTGWYLLTCSVTSVTSSSLAVYAANANNGVVFTGANNTDGIYIWGASLYRSDLGGMQPNTSAYPMYNPTTPKNLLGYTELFSDSWWTKVNTSATITSTPGPLGNGYATLVYPTSTGVDRGVWRSSGVSGSTSTPYTISIYAKANGKNFINFFSLAAAGNINGVAVFDLQNGIRTQVGSYFTSASITPVGNGWYRCTATATSASSTLYTFVGIVDATGTSTVTASGTDGVLLWGAQLSDSASLDSYVPVYGAAVTSAAYYGPRRDFDPVTLACKGLLVEEQRTNFLLYSAAFDNVAWNKGGGTTVDYGFTAPDGSSTAWRVTFPNGSAGSQFYQAMSASLGFEVTQSLWIKADSSLALTYGFYDSTGDTTNITATSTWQKFTKTRAAGLITGDRRAQWLYLTGASAPQSIYIWNAQLENGSFATSYIPTTGGATATRLADVASVSTQAFPYSATEGTLVAAFNGMVVSGTATNAVVSISDGTTSNRIDSYSDAFYSLYVVSGGSPQANIDAGTVSVNTVTKIGSAFAENNFAAVINGGTVGTDPSGTVPAVNRMYIGAGSAGGQQLNGHIRQITYLPRRISNTELQTRTA